MVINTTRWSPDTCSCVIDYDWDSTATEDNRVHTLNQFVNVCPLHQQLATNQDRYSCIFEENPRKNTAQQLILDSGPAQISDIINGVKVLKANLSFQLTWSGTPPNRLLTVAINDSNGNVLTTQQKGAIQTFLNNRFGVGKVVIA
jgi:hypothetical protein